MSERKKKKLFGVFNIVDILLIVIVLVGAVIGWKLLAGKGQAEQAAGKVYSYVVMGPEVLDETADFPVIGGNAYNSSTSVYLGTVEDFQTEPYTEIVYDEQEEAFRKLPVEGYSTIYLTIAGQGTETERDITVEGTTVKVGMELNVKGKGYAFKGIVVEVRDGE